MSQFLFFFSGFFLGGAAVWSYFRTHCESEEVSPKKKKEEGGQEEERSTEGGSSLEDYNTKRQKKTDKKKEQIIKRAKKEGYIKTGDVQEMFNVSRSTAYRYLSELEEEGKIEQTKEYGRKVRYTLVE